MADAKENGGHIPNGNMNGVLPENEIADYDESEYSALDSELDRLDSCLDALENWNDSLNSRMREFLENMQKTREITEQEKTKDLSNEEMELDK